MDRKTSFIVYDGGIIVIIIIMWLLGFNLTQIDVSKRWILFIIWSPNIIIGIWLTYVILKDNTDNKNREEPLNIIAGSIRTYLIFIFTFVIYIILRDTPGIEIPIHLLIIIGVILTYYKLKTDKVLPKKFVVSSGVPSFISSEYFLQNYKTVKAQIKNMIKKSKNLPNITNAGDKKDELREIKSLTKNTLELGSVGEKIALGILLVFLSMLGQRYIEMTTGPVTPETILIVSTSRVLIGIIFGALVSDALVMILWKMDLKVHFETFRAEVTIEIDGNYDHVRFSPNLIKFQGHKSVQLMLFDFLAIITIHTMTVMSTIILLEPTLDINSLPFYIMEILIAFYFGTK